MPLQTKSRFPSQPSCSSLKDVSGSSKDILSLLSPSRASPGCPLCHAEYLSEVSIVSQRSLRTAPLGQIFFAGQQFGAVCPLNGIPHLTSYCEQWIFERTGQRPKFRELFGRDVHQPGRVDCETEQQFCHGNSLRCSGDPPLPEKWIVESLVADFTASEFGLAFPLINPLLFEETLMLAYTAGQTQSTPESMTAKACVLAFVCLSSSHCPTSKASSDIDCDFCIKAAKSFMSEIIDDVSVTTLQTVMMLLLYDTLRGHLLSSTMYHALACRIVLALGGHRLTMTLAGNRDMTRQEHEDRHIRVLFWLCYIFDKDIALRSGQPPVIVDQFCDLTLPDGYYEYQFRGLQKSPKGGLVQNPWLPGDLRLSMVKSKALQTLYSCSSLQMSDAELLKTIRELDEELESWRKSMPGPYSPSLSIRKDVKLAQDASVSQNMLFIHLHMDYHFLLNIIHFASGRCTRRGCDSAQGLTFGVQSSFEISVEASRSTLIFLGATAALLTLFFNILQNPGHSLARHDMELLGKASQIIRRMPMWRVTSYETEYLVKIDRLAAELSRLGSCAIDRHLANNLPC
ncbi:hypothetical protein E4U42_003394 [Claviceps africana]|uniref:Xylanolytic transcriptional activator regulatory domain-containing protein n=1 Tax=Claviceps africana TaxID=83212 RepID=A0A8K0J7B1_9HYPO|nr:hypothetical protein E4U42_003394 [Claviceps africana]